MITADFARSSLDYNPETGELFRIDRGYFVNSVDVHGYTRLVLGGRLYKAHRVIFLIMTGEWPKGLVDHINHKRDDNRWINLRVVNTRDNSRNCSIRNTNKSGVQGVSWDKVNSKWVVRISTLNGYANLGRFSDLDTAKTVRKNAEMFFGYHSNHGA